MVDLTHRSPRWWKHALEGLMYTSRRKAIAEVCEGLSTLLEAGLPLHAAFAHLQTAGLPRAHQPYINLGVAGIEKGLPLSDVWRPLIPQSLLSLLMIGEFTGKLPYVLQEWSNHAREHRQWIERLLKLFSYPVLLVILTVGVMLFASNVMLPSFTSMYTELHLPVSPSTRLLIHILISLPAGIALVATGSICTVCLAWLMRVKCPLIWTALERRLPGARIRRVARTYHVARVLALFISAGFPVADALRVLSEVYAKPWLRNAMTEIRDRILAGWTLSDAFRGDWDPVLPMMLGYAQQTGDLAASLVRVEHYTRHHLQQALERIAGILQPALILVIGFVVTLTMCLVFIPMYDLMTNVTGAHMN